MPETLTPARQRRKKYRAKWYQENKERISKIQRIWYMNNKEAIQKTGKAYYRKHKKSMNAASTEWQKKNRALSNSYCEKWKLAKYGPKNLIPCRVCGAQLNRRNEHSVCSRTFSCRAALQRIRRGVHS